MNVILIACISSILILQSTLINNIQGLKVREIESAQAISWHTRGGTLLFLILNCALESNRAPFYQIESSHKVTLKT